jgi:glycosyltransferase involved in cell wall biosynthesis
VTAKKEEYTYLDLLPGLEIDIQPATTNMEKWTEQCCNYVKENYHKIDILFCFGSYTSYTKIVPLYKSLRRDGKVILKLDANSGWLDKISMENESYRNLYNNCSVITCESKKLKRLLSRKWPYKIDYVVNGYLDIEKSNDYLEKTSYCSKENIILTVGRIGTPQKANHILLEAFAMCSNELNGWKLKLVGSIEPEFEPYIESYFKHFPYLRDKVIFTGKIKDKGLLNEEYRKAKIFAMSSVYEGGTPNVFIEAARYGCYMICSDFDAADEFTNHRKCGEIFEINNTFKLRDILLKISKPEYEAVFQSNFYEIQKYRERYFNYEVMVKKLMHLLQIGEEKV